MPPAVTNKAANSLFSVASGRRLHSLLDTLDQGDERRLRKGFGIDRQNPSESL
ncbi:MAG: hypothetical protein [Olavius algarvensis Gamma 1 endosymbiont]|nr:MAG: hypothetical protein [Olavius algarvensis Gamma 1 endosymbiont]